MPQKTSVKVDTRHTREWFKRQVDRVNDAPSVAPEQPYAFENGTVYVQPRSEDHPLIPDSGFDGPA